MTLFVVKQPAEPSLSNRSHSREWKQGFV